MLEDTALLQSMGIAEDSSSDSDSCGSEYEELESSSEDDETSFVVCENEAACELPKDNHKNTEEEDTQTQPSENFLSQVRFDPDFSSKEVALANPTPSNETLLSWLRENRFNWFSFYNDLEQYLKPYSAQVLNQALLDFTEYLSASDLTDEEERIVEISRQAFLDYMRKPPLVIKEEEVVSESESELQGPETSENQSLLSEERKQQIQSARRAIRQRARRTATKQRASQGILKRRIPKRARDSSLIQPCRSHTHCEKNPQVDGVSALRNSFRQFNFSPEVTDIIMASWRSGSKKQYKSYIEKWLVFCRARSVDYCSPPISDALEFLMKLYVKSLGYSTLTTARSALSSILRISDCDSFRSHSLVIRFMKSVFEKRKLQPKNDKIWDASKVLHYLSTLQLVKELSLKDLSLKVLMLLLLVTGQRGQSLADSFSYEAHRMLLSVPNT
ncbi:hypothetical protein ACROYT_G001244 [Oculina patagonica]